MGSNAELAKKRDITKKNFDVPGHIERISKTDPLPACALHSTATLLYRMDWGRHAITVWRKCIELKPDYYEAIGNLGICLALRGTGKMLIMQAYHRSGKPAHADRARREGLSDWGEAEKLFKEALKINPDYNDAARNLRLLRNQMESFRRGVIIVPQMR
jgi:tetratricopeptide (TPR) repeat protein